MTSRRQSTRAIEGNNLPFIIAAATKQRMRPTGTVSYLQHYGIILKVIEHYIERFDDVKYGFVEPTRWQVSVL